MNDEQPIAGDDAGQPFHPAVVYQAQGAVSITQGLSVKQAAALMHEYALHHGISISELATMIMAGEVSLDPPPVG